MRKEQFAPWEVRTERLQPVDVDAWKEKLKTRPLKTRGQWFYAFRRRVTVPLADARKVITTMEGRQLHLFSEDQTELI